MKSTIRKSTFRAMYRLLDRVSPVPYDCGKLCDCVCCMPAGDELGIYLLPGEEKLFTGKEDWITWNYDNVDEYEFPDSWSGKVAFLSCNTPPVCDRKMRPLQCRTYPVAPHILEDEMLILILSDMEVPYTCPLIKENTNFNPESKDDSFVLDEKFLRATYTVWKRLIKDPKIYDLVKMDSEERDFFIPVFPSWK